MTAAMDPKLEEMLEALRSEPAMSDLPIDKLLKYAIRLREQGYSPQLNCFISTARPSKERGRRTSSEHKCATPPTRLPPVIPFPTFAPVCHNQ